MTEMSENNTVCHILNLNDDCFNKIYKYLPITDLCSLRGTCTRLQSFSDDWFDRNNKTLELDGECISGSFHKLTPMEDNTRVIQNFGKFITKLTVDQNVFQQDYYRYNMIPLLDRYCVALEDLKLVKLKVYTVQIHQCDRLFSKLHRLVIDKCFDNEASLTACLTHCRSLKELELIRLYNIKGRILANNFKSLESFSIKNCNDFEYNFMQQFFVQNPQLKSLKLIECDYLADRLVQDIANHLPNLEALSLLFKHFLRSIDIVTPLMPLAKLKKLEIDLRSFSFTDFEPFFKYMAAHNNIEHLLLTSVRFSDGLVRTLCELKTLKILKFVSIDEFDAAANCKKLATELPLLTEIHLIECFRLTFNELKQFVEHSMSLKRIVFNRCKDDIPSLTKDMFSLLLETIQRTRKDKTLYIHLNQDDLWDSQYEIELDENTKILSEHAHEIKLLPLEEEDVLTWNEYGSGGRKYPYFDGDSDRMDIDESEEDWDTDDV